jgi:hypothetical protein
MSCRCAANRFGDFSAGNSPINPRFPLQVKTIAQKLNSVLIENESAQGVQLGFAFDRFQQIRHGLQEEVISKIV